MTYPVDDAGNPRVDFVWGNMAMQPNDQRDVVTAGPEPLYPANGEGNFGWDATFIYPSEGLYSSVTQALSIGDKDGFNGAWDDVATRTVSVPADNHSVALTGYNNYPAFIENYAGDGDTGLERVVPNIEGLSEEAAYAALSAAGWNETQNLGALYVGATASNDGKVKQITTGIQNVDAVIQFKIYTYTVTVPNVVDFDSVAAAEEALILAGLVLGTVTTSTVGATSGNNNWVKSQSPAANATAVIGSAVNLVEYDYVEAPAPSTTGPIAGFNRVSAGTSFSLNGNQSVMYVTGRTVKPTVGDTISVTGSDDASHNVSWTVAEVENNDSYNTGGTAVKVTLVTGAITSDTATGGTWTKI